MTEEFFDGLNIPLDVEIEMISDGEYVLFADAESGEIYDTYTIH